MAVSLWELGWLQYNAGEFTDARGNLEQSIAYFGREEFQDIAFLYGLPEVAALTWLANSLWCLGYPDRALERSRETLALAERLGQNFTKAFALCFAAGLFHVDRREISESRESIEESIQLSRENVYPMMLGVATCLQGLVESGTDLGKGLAQIREAIAIDEMGLHWSRAVLLAEVQWKAGDVDHGLMTLNEALAHIDETGERSHEAETHRLKGELLLTKRGAEAEAEASIHKAIQVARRQHAKSWELRATMSLARLWKRQGKKEEALEILKGIYDWFTEGFDTPDLKDAKALLEELA
jgi:adenylate cyclase